MGRTPATRRTARDRRRPGLEPLEARQLLSAAPSGSSFLNPDGSVDFDQVDEASAARLAFGVDGSGESVALIDTGVDYKNPALGGATGPGDKVLPGVDFTGSPNGVLPTWQHGTGVAGIIASTAEGVAPGASVVPLRVFGDDNQGDFTDIAEALEWVIQHHAADNITAVNLSVSDGGNYTSDIFTEDGGIGQRMAQDVEDLDALNIPVVIASGNSFNGKAQGMGFPAIVPDAISVTATDESGGKATATTDRFDPDAQRLGKAKGGVAATTIAAPGVNIEAPSGDVATAMESGTSFATPQVTGTILLLQQMYQAAYHTLPTVATLDGLLQGGADPIRDAATGVTIGRLDTLKSLTLLSQEIHPATPAPAVTTPAAAANAPAQATAKAVPMTRVILNGTSIGSYPTASLARKYAALLGSRRGATTTLQISAPKGSTVVLGPNIPSRAVPAGYTSDPRVRQAAAAAIARVGGSSGSKAQTKAAPPPPATPAHHVAAPKPKKKAKSFLFGLPFPF